MDVVRTMPSKLPAKDVFTGVVFAIIEGSELPHIGVEVVIRKVESHGGTHRDLDSENLHDITHIISPTSDFPAYHDAVDALIHIVKPSWVDQSLLKEKQVNTRTYTPDPRMFMSDVILTFANDVPLGDRDAIIAGVNCFGGQYSEKLTRPCTHVVALSMDNQMCKVVQEKNLQTEIVLPHWFDECLKIGKFLDSAPYKLPNPPILEPGYAVSKRLPSSPSIKGACCLSPQPPDAKASERDCMVFRGRCIKLDTSLDISDHLRSTLHSIIKSGSGEVVDQVEEADILICAYRDCQDYGLASRKGLDVANLSWLYYVINRNQWTSPTRRLLHYPLPRNGLPGFASLRIGISNYTGESRTYLENLIRASGATYTKTLSEDNTHLITAHTSSDKVDAAREWNINVINHLWLEESYARCKMQSVTSPAYNSFPRATNLAQVIGQTPFDRDALQRHYFPEDTTDEEAPPSKRMVETPSSCARNGIQTNSSPIHTPRSRGAKNRAIDKLHKMAPDIAAFQKESKRVGGVIYGGRRVSDPDRVGSKQSSMARKRSHDMHQIDSSDIAPDDGGQRSSKKSRNGDCATDLVVIATALSEGVHHQEFRQLKSISGIQTLDETPQVSEGGKIDVVIAPSVRRTTKFFAGIAAGATFVSQDWMRHVLETGNVNDLAIFQLRDAVTEEQNNFVLAQAVGRAKEHKERGGMLHGWTIFVTEGVKGGADMMREIVEVNGGSVVIFKGRRTPAPPPCRRQRADIEQPAAPHGDEAAEDENGPPGHLFCLTVAQDKRHWEAFRDIAAEGNYTPCLVKTEWLLRVALAQDLGVWQGEWAWEGSKGTTSAGTLPNVSGVLSV